MDLTETVRLATSGDRDAFGDLVRRYERLVLGIAWNLLRDHQAAQDVAQEAFLTAFRQLATLKDPSAFGAWVAQITARGCRQFRKSDSTVSLAAVHDPSKAAAEFLIISEETDRALSAIQTLPEHERSVVLLRYVEGYDMATIARMTSRPLGTVTKQLSRAMQRLKDRLVHCQDEK